MDEYLLEKDLSPFLEPWRYGRLNTLERLLLARRLPAQQAAEVRALQDLLAMTPVNREEDRRRLETALQGFSLARSAGGAGGMGGGGEGKDQGELGDAKSKLAMLGGRMAVHRDLAVAAIDRLLHPRPLEQVGLGALGQYMKRTNPSFAPKVYGHSTLSDMVRCYPELAVTQGQGNGWWVSLKPLAEPTKAGSS
mgnify:CR=1 FL=1